MIPIKLITAERERRIINKELREGRELSMKMAASATRGVDRRVLPKGQK